MLVRCCPLPGGPSHAASSGGFVLPGAVLDNRSVCVRAVIHCAPCGRIASVHTSHTHHVLCMMNRHRGYLTLSKRSPTAHSGTRPGLCSAPTTCCQWYPARLPACAATAQAPAGAGSGSKHFSLPPLARCKEQFFGDFPHIKY